jgi:ring-1,2-phenylacetyl-CoA epoxidase subunit PaaE
MSFLHKQIKLVSAYSETPEAKSFEFVPVGDWPLRYEAGQFITLVFPKRDGEERRSYSFSSAPVLNEPLRITVKRIANGEYSRRLVDQAQPGDIFYSAGVSGFFKLPADYKNRKQLVFLAAGSGITPVFSLVKTALHTTLLPVILIYSNRAEKSTIFFGELIRLQEQFGDRLQVRFLYSHIDHAHRIRLSKWVLTELLEQYNIPMEETLFYMCGPVGYMLMAEITLITAGAPSQNIKREIFSTRKHIIRPVPPDTARHQAEIHVNNEVHQISVQFPDTILAAAKKQQVQLPYSCEAGNCGSCAATCVRGEVWMAYNEVLMDEEIAKGKVLTCQGYPVGGDVILTF